MCNLVRNGCAARARSEEKLVVENRFNYLLVESAGISEPLPIAETFTFRDDNEVSLSDIAQLDTMVTVVDGYSFCMIITHLSLSLTAANLWVMKIIAQWWIY